MAAFEKPAHGKTVDCYEICSRQSPEKWRYLLAPSTLRNECIGSKPWHLRNLRRATAVKPAKHSCNSRPTNIRSCPAAPLVHTQKWDTGVLQEFDSSHLRSGGRDTNFYHVGNQLSCHAWYAKVPAQNTGGGWKFRRRASKTRAFVKLNTDIDGLSGKNDRGPHKRTRDAIGKEKWKEMMWQSDKRISHYVTIVTRVGDNYGSYVREFGTADSSVLATSNERRLNALIPLRSQINREYIGQTRQSMHGRSGKLR